MKVLKFGGSSMATPDSIKRVAEIILSREGECAAVVSAPGKRTKDDVKVTDLLFQCYTKKLESGRCDAVFARVEERFLSLAKGLGVDGLKPYLDRVLHDINSGASLGYTVSRGEFLAGLLLRHLLSCEFIDAGEMIKFDMDGNFDSAASEAAVAGRLKGSHRAVVPGYYGAMPNGEIKVFSRGGSDVTGAVIAGAVDAEIYENWTDVDGVYFCPLTHLCGPVPRLSYCQMRELSFLGAVVLHPDSFVPLSEKGIPVRIKNTFNPDKPGTLIVPECEGCEKVIGLSGRTGFKLFTFYSMGSAGGDYIGRLTRALERQGAKLFTLLGGVDYYSAVTDAPLPPGCGLIPTSEENIALVTVVGGDKKSVINKMNALGIDYKFLQASPGCAGIIAGVAEEHLNDALEVLCNALKDG